jgi:hypothetical protein
MSNLKNIGNKLFKETTELKSHEVELGVADAVMLIKTDAKSKINSAANNISKAVKEFDSFLNKIKQAEKDLGIDLSKEYSEINKSMTKAKQLLKKTDSLTSDLSSF